MAAQPQQIQLLQNALAQTNEAVQTAIHALKCPSSPSTERVTRPREVLPRWIDILGVASCHDSGSDNGDGNHNTNNDNSYSGDLCHSTGKASESETSPMDK